MRKRYLSRNKINKVTISTKTLTFRYVDYCVKMVKLLLKNGVIPVLVFDGRDVPIKEKENESRAKYFKQ